MGRWDQSFLAYAYDDATSLNTTIVSTCGVGYNGILPVFVLATSSQLLISQQIYLFLLLSAY